MLRDDGVVWYLTIEKLEADAALVLDVAGRVSAAASAELERALADAANGPHRGIVVDLTRADYVSSAGLRVLETAATTFADRGCRLVVCGVGPAVEPVFELAAATSRLIVESSRDLAVVRALSG